MQNSTKYRIIWPAFCILLTAIATPLEIMCVLHGIHVKDYSFASECFCYCLLLGIIPIINCSTIYGRNNMLKILDEMNQDFLYICKLKQSYRNHFLKNQLLIWKLCFSWLWFFCLMAIMYATLTLVPLVYQSLFATLDEQTVRPLIFPVWLYKGDPYMTPNYEMLLILELAFLIIFIQTFAVYVYIQFHVLLHNNILLDLIIKDFEVIFEGLDEGAATLARTDPLRVAVQHTLNRRVKRIVTWHTSVFKSVATISSVHGPPLMYQIMISSTAVSLILYQIAESLQQGKLDIMFVMLFFGVTGQVWIPCYLGTILRNKAFRIFMELCGGDSLFKTILVHSINPSLLLGVVKGNKKETNHRGPKFNKQATAVGDACWNCGWQESPLGRLLRTDFIIIILRSQQPLSIKFTGLPLLSLEKFSSILSTAYSYFNLLRQYSM